MRKTGAGRGEAVLLPPAKGCPPPGGGQALAAGTPGGSRGKGGMALLLGWQRDEVERGKCRKLLWALRAKAENSAVSPAHLSPRPPRPAAAKNSPEQSPSLLREGASLPCHPAAAPVGPHAPLHPGLGGPSPAISGGWRGLLPAPGPFKSAPAPRRFLRGVS